MYVHIEPISIDKGDTFFWCGFSFGQNYPSTKCHYLRKLPFNKFAIILGNKI